VTLVSGSGLQTLENQALSGAGGFSMGP